MILVSLLNIAIFQGIVLGTIILRSPFFKNETNKYLAYAIFTLSISLLNFVLDETEAYISYPFLRFFDIVDSALLFPVFIFLYASYQVNHQPKYSKKSYWLFLPFILSIIYSISDECVSINIPDNNFSILLLITNLFGFVIFIITLFFIPFILFKTFQSIKLSTNIQEKKWLTYLWLFEVIFLTSWLIAIILSLFIESKISNAMHIIALFTTLLIHWVAYFGVYKFKLANDQQKIRFILTLRNQKETSVSISKASKLKQKEHSKPSEYNLYFKKLEGLCANQKIYRDNTLDRNKVAEMLNISPSYISQIVNSSTGNNFATYINHYRVEDAKKFILDKEFENYSLLAIGLECGFSSKTTYYNSFKKITGLTPNAYRKNHQ
ncbi:helix-turn-helix domain-containing protein [Tenacibaculum ovolyticum]|uniref:helix-turn-helix domain-containing protein n=1 Tax=Tenacibaculum ovolyticum TaxID=104270 RepID=UPI0007EC2E9C|nr:helix-turn-helix domain-containing protein [Tenacibaculum ovolyticum]